MKALVGAFNQEKALVGAFSVIVQLHRLIIYTALLIVLPFTEDSAPQLSGVSIIVSVPTQRRV